MSSLARGGHLARAVALVVVLGAPASRPDIAIAGGPSPLQSPSHTPDSAVDYAPSGVPDFGQCRAAWSRAGSPGQWTHAGPVAVADALWWLDSVNEPGAVAPPAVADGERLVTAYPVFGPGHDDHDVANLGPLVEDLAMRDNTEGVLHRDGTHGTRWEDLRSGTEGYVASHGAGEWAVETRDHWDAEWATLQLDQGGAVVALLGVWEQQQAGSIRVGGHYAAVVGTLDRLVVLADPLADRGDAPGGRWVPPDPSRHSCREDPGAHDDAAVLSHDAYVLGDAGLPGGRPVLSGYFTLDTEGEAAAFADQNPADFLTAYEGPWQRDHVWMALDALLAVSPVATVSPTPTATAVNTGTALPPTANPTPTPRSSPPPTGAPTLPDPTATTADEPTARGSGAVALLYLPFATARR